MDELHHINRLLLVFLVILLLIIAGLTTALIKSPKQLSFWLTPEVSANGGVVKPENIPDEYVQGFVATLIPNLYSWHEKGKESFDKNLTSYQYYFTPHFKALLTQMSASYDKAQLFERNQSASLYRFFEPEDIKRVGKDCWEVHLVMRLTQKLNEQASSVIADKVVDYHFKIVKVSLSKLQNPFGLAIDGYTQPEKLSADLLTQNLGEANVD